MKKILSLTAILAIPFLLYTQCSLKPEIQVDPPLATANEEIELVFTSTTDTLRDSILHFGKQFLGTPYAAGGCTVEGFDCSGFVYFVFKHFNITVPRYSSQYANYGTQIPISAAKIGDVLVFKSPSRSAIGHVGIVTKPNGMETEFMHATSGKAKQVVISSLGQVGYKNRFIKVVDVLDK